MATSTFTINGNKTLTVAGSVYTLGVTSTGATFKVGNTSYTSSYSGKVTANTNLTITGSESSAIFTATNGTIKVDDAAVVSGTTKSFPAGSTHTVTFTANSSQLTVEIPDTIELYLNETKLVNGTTVTLGITNKIRAVQIPQTVTIVPEYQNLNSFAVDEKAVLSGSSVTLAPGNHTVSAVGATTIPEVNINGDGLSALSINGTDVPINSLPYSFRPLGAVTNSVYAKGVDTADRSLTISGTHISAITVNNEEVTLPYTVNVNEPLDISVSGELYQVDVSSKGGVIILKDGEVMSNGEAVHQIIDIDADTYISLDGTHILEVTGVDLKSITVNGVTRPIDQLPVIVENNAMTATVSVEGYPPSEIHVTGMYIDTATLDGNPVKIGANGSVDLEVEVREENHFLNVIGQQPRPLEISWNDNGVTTLEMDGVAQTTGTPTSINKDVYIEAEANPIPVNFATDEFSNVLINGKPYTGDFTTNVSRETFVTVDSQSARLTIDYGDNSFTLTVPRRMITIAAPHRDGWIFDTWTSNNVGIISPRSVQCNVDMTNVSTAHIVANYQRYLTMDKPNNWN